MPPKSSKEKNEHEIRRLAKLDGNKVCVDCPEKMPTMVDMTYKTFVCSQCAIIHRELQYKVKGISMTTFTDEDIAELSKGGNNVCNAQYLARGGKEFPVHGGGDMMKLRDYIKAKYIEKRWFSPDGLTEVPPLVESKTRRNSVTIPIPTAAPSQRGSITAAHAVKSDGIDLLSMSEKPFDPFAEDGAKKAAAAPAATASNFDPFSTPAAAQSQPSNQFDSFSQRADPNVHFDPFGHSTQSTAAGATASAGFDPFCNSSGAASANHGAGVSGFDPFGGPSVQSFSAQPSHSTAFADPFSAPTASAAPVAMPFIKTAPPPAPTPSEPVKLTEAAAPTKPPVPGFSAFDDIAVPSHPSNPFDAPVSNVSAAQPQPAANPFGAPTQGYGPAPGVYGGYPVSAGPPQMHPYGAGPGYIQYGPPTGSYPTAPAYAQPYGYPHGAVPHGAAPHGAVPVPHSSGYGYPVPQPYAPYPGNNPQPTAVPPNPPAAAQAAPDPFSSMGGLAWSSVGKPVPVPSANYGHATASNAPSTVTQPTQPPSSANPFDLF